MITTIIPYQQATLYQPAAPVPEKAVVPAGVAAPVTAMRDSIDLSPAAQARMAKDAAEAETAANETESLQEAAKRTIAALKRHQGRDFTARGVEITDPDISMSGKAVDSLRAIKPQLIVLKDMVA